MQILIVAGRNWSSLPMACIYKEVGVGWGGVVAPSLRSSKGADMHLCGDGEVASLPHGICPQSGEGGMGHCMFLCGGGGQGGQAPPIEQGCRSALLQGRAISSPPSWHAPPRSSGFRYGAHWPHLPAWVLISPMGPKPVVTGVAPQGSTPWGTHPPSRRRLAPASCCRSSHLQLGA